MTNVICSYKLVIVKVCSAFAEPLCLIGTHRRSKEITSKDWLQPGKYCVITWVQSQHSRNCANINFQFKIINFYRLLLLVFIDKNGHHIVQHIHTVCVCFWCCCCLMHSTPLTRNLQRVNEEQKKTLLNKYISSILIIIDFVPPWCL